jgi:hypothetical protein
MVEHVAEASPAPLDLARTWRRATYVAGAVAAVELVLLLILGGAVLGPALADAIKGAAREQVFAAPEPAKRAVKAKPAKAKAAVARLPRGRTEVMVLNGNGRNGAAGDAADRVRGRGYRLGEVGNAPRSDYARSIVMFRDGFRGEAERLARDLRIKVVAPLDGMRRGELKGAHTALILGIRD